jgi:hypothetical protein
MGVRVLTLMLWLCHQLSNHGLDNANVAIQETTYCSSKESNPDVGSKSNHNHAEHGTQAPQEKNWFSADPVGETAPVHSHQGLGEGKRGDKEAGVEGGILLVANLEPLDKGPGIGKDGGEGDGLGQAHDCYPSTVRYCSWDVGRK